MWIPEIISLLQAVGRRPRSGARKQELIDSAPQIQSEVRRGDVTLPPFLPSNASPEGTAHHREVNVRRALCTASLSSCVMKPLVLTSGMKGGSINEEQVLRNIPPFIAANACVDLVMRETTGMDRVAHLSVEPVREVGLLQSKTMKMMADSPDGLVSMTVRDFHPSCRALSALWQKSRK